MLFLTQSDYENLLDQENHPRVIQDGEGGIDNTIKDAQAGFKTYLTFVKKIAQQVWNGNFNFSTCQVPSVLSQSRTFLEVQADDFLYIIEACKKMLSIKEPIKKLQYLSTAFVASFHNSLLNSEGKTPLNSFMGETLYVVQKDRNE